MFPVLSAPRVPVSFSPYLRSALLPHSVHDIATNESAVSTNHTRPQGKPLLVFSQPLGASQAEVKMDALTRKYEKKMDKREQESEFFGGTSERCMRHLRSPHY